MVDTENFPEGFLLEKTNNFEEITVDYKKSKLLCMQRVYLDHGYIGSKTNASWTNTSKPCTQTNRLRWDQLMSGVNILLIMTTPPITQDSHQRSSVYPPIKMAARGAAYCS